MCPPGYHHNDFMALLRFCEQDAMLYNPSTDELRHLKLTNKGFATHRVIREPDLKLDE